MFENFKRLVTHPDFTDKATRGFFYRLDSEYVADAFELLKQHRPRLAKQIKEEIIAETVLLREANLSGPAFA
ncbi:hypothetical protein MYX07_00130 [Patescibacteria group bacterium AH-259-L07]|nr:hypothetical protein [Patescibacteria group bacterium AH-259-L07]